MKRFVKFIWLVVLVIIDQITKHLIVLNYDVGEGIELVKDILEIQYVQNTGAAWGMMAGKTNFFSLFSSVVIIFLLYIMIKIPSVKEYNYLKVTIILLISGAIGNLIDRVTIGYVVDFIYFKIIDFPVFNIADIYITISGIALVILIMFYYKDEQFEFLAIKKKEKNEKLN